MWKMGCRPPLRRVRGILNALNAKSRQQATCFLSSLMWACFFCLHCALKYGRRLFLIILTSMWKMGCRPPLGRVRGILNALKAKFRQQATCFSSSLRWACKVQTTSNMFLELTKVGMFLFVFTVPLNMAEAYFPLFWHLCGQWAVGPPWEGSEAF